ncbi:hypothetical protein NE237_007546 [Protea cynaroides]|uniref:Uncharacterized protein n=1 Tax=Protea cynaroides TaxID=273540 RepID=A0A9Q0KPK8_9MAGN|nr:hypothetical protein NE237_007546 [Protea cynaroides]
METLEIPVLNRISDFESGLNRLQNPSFVSRVINLVGIEEIFLNYSLWTWGALILAIIATFSSLINRIKVVILQRHVDSEHFLRPLVEDDEDDTCSWSSSNDEDELPNSSFENQRPFDVDFRAAGSGNYDEDQCQWLKLRRQFCCGKSVVKLWDGLGLGVGLKIEGSSTENVVSMWDLNNAENISSVHGGRVSSAAPPVVLTAGVEDSGKVALRVWDGRVGCQIPVISTGFRPRRRRTVVVDSSGEEKVFVTDDSGSLTVRDMRKIEFTMESDGDQMWWNADAAIVSAGDREGCVEGAEEQSRRSYAGSLSHNGLTW